MPKVSIVSKKILLNPNQQNENRLKIHKETMSILDRIFKGYSMHLISYYSNSLPRSKEARYATYNYILNIYQISKYSKSSNQQYTILKNLSLQKWKNNASEYYFAVCMAHFMTKFRFLKTITFTDSHYLKFGVLLSPCYVQARSLLPLKHSLNIQWLH